MVVGLLGNESPDSNRFTLVTPKPENGVRLQATLGNQNPMGLPVGAVSSTKLEPGTDVLLRAHVIGQKYQGNMIRVKLADSGLVLYVDEADIYDPEKKEVPGE